ncbi:MAG: HD domain-containing protein [Pseudomonadota bacterium]
MENKKLYVKDIKDNLQVEGLFLVRDKNNGITKNGKPYIALNLADKTGEIKARIWDHAEKLGSQFLQGEVVKIKAFAVLYQGLLQLNISAIEKCIVDGSGLRDFLPASKLDPEAGFAEIMTQVSEIENEYLRKLLELIFSDHELVKAFKSAPAAKSIHHDFLGGLLEHTCNVMRLAVDMAKHYKNVNRDVLVTGAILHDIGKIYELSYEKNFDYTDRGRLIGHITLADSLITEKIQLIPDFPVDLASVVRHIILSHHGQYEFGSPKRPKTLEALLLSYLDDIDAKMFGFAQFIRKEKSPDTKWTSYHKLFERYIYTSTFIEDELSGTDASDEAIP